MSEFASQGRRTFSFREYVDMPPSPKISYKDMEVLEFILVSERYVLLVCRVPAPYGGTHRECVPIDEIVSELSK